MLIAFAGIWFFSVTDKSKAAEDERALFFPQFVRSQTGLGPVARFPTKVLLLPMTPRQSGRFYWL